MLQLYKELFTNKLNDENLLIDLVNIDSQVGNFHGIQTIQLLIEKKLQSLGLSTTFYPNKMISTPPLLVGKYHCSDNAKTVTFICHSDVVTSPKKVFSKVIGDKLYGSGVADNKGGIVAGLSALKSFLTITPYPNININFIVSPNEETGSIGFHQLFQAFGLNSDFVIGLEPALSCGSLITSRSGNRWYKFLVNGIASHAGRFGANHINAAHKLSMLITKMHKLNNEKKLRRVNVGSISGGNGGFNTICDQAKAKIDTRFSTFECRNYLHQEIEKIIDSTSISCPYSHKKTHIFYSIEDDCPPLDKKSSIHPWIHVLFDAIEDHENRQIQGLHAGGAADINYFASPGKILIDGLGPIGGDLHTSKEYILKDSLSTRSKAIERFLRKYNFAEQSWRSKYEH